MKAATLHRWSVVHTWSSLICTVFLLAICITGWPLIFADEIDRLTDTAPAYQAMPAQTPRADVDGIIARAEQSYPTQMIRYLYWSDTQPTVLVGLAPSDDAADGQDHTMTFDARTGIERKRDLTTQHLRFMDVMEHIHEDLFLGLPGELFLGFMALLFVIAIASGVVLYAPFMRRVEFGARRAPQGSRLAWLDLHNILSVAALLWMGIVGLTGLINELATPLFNHWLAADVRPALQSGAEQSLPTQLASASAVVRSVEQHLPGRKIETIDFPTKHFGSPRHFVIWTRGDRPLTSRLYVPVLVDAVSGQFVAAKSLPWYLFVLEISRPLHFGDYGGLPLKVIWALFDLMTIIVLASGLKLWWSRRQRTAQRRLQLDRHAHEWNS